MKRFRWLSAFSAVSLVLAGCSDSDALGRLRIELTDAPGDYIESAEVWISRVYVVPGADGEAGVTDLFNDPDNPQLYDLLTLQDGVTANLTGDVAVGPGDFQQLRLVVDSARITLKPEYSFSDGSQALALTVPSGAQSGIKVVTQGPVTVTEGETTVLVVDFSVEDNFVFQGDPESPEGLRGILFTPVLKTRVSEQTEGT